MDATHNSSSPHPVRGRPFAQGNPGRPRGAQNRSTLMAEALLEGDAETMIRKAVDLAMAGDRTMLKFFLKRLLPGGRKIHIDLPEIKTSLDAVDAQAAVLAALSRGELTLEESAMLSALIEALRRTIVFAEVHWVAQPEEVSRESD